MSLLDTAKAVPVKTAAMKTIPSEEVIELAIAWAIGTVTAVQARHALNVPSTATAEGKMNAALRYAIAKGVLKTA